MVWVEPQAGGNRLPYKAPDGAFHSVRHGSHRKNADIGEIGELQNLL